jgi:hypothetical protein
LLANPFALAIMVVLMIVKVRMIAVKVMVIVSMVVVVIVSMVVVMIVSMVVVVTVPMVVAVVVIVPMVVMVLMLLGVVHRSAAGGIEHVELGPRDAPAGHLSRSELYPLHPESGHMAPDLVQARSKIEEGAHEHVAAHPCRRVEVEDALHFELSFRPPAASLLIMSAW